MSRISLVCPHCGHEGKLPEFIKTISKAVRCPGYQKQFRNGSVNGDDFIVVGRKGRH